MRRTRSAEDIRKDRQDIATLKAAHRDPDDLEKRVAAYRVELMQKRAGRLEPYTILKGGALCR